MRNISSPEPQNEAYSSDLLAIKNAQFHNNKINKPERFESILTNPANTNMNMNMNNPTNPTNKKNRII